MRSFGEALRSSMKKDAKIKDYDTEKNSFINSASSNAIQMNASTKEGFYGILFEALIYKNDGSDGIKLPDLSKGWISQTINSKIPLNAGILEVAQQKNVEQDIAEYFRVNLIPNIAPQMKNTTLADIHSLVENDLSLGIKELRSLKRKKDSQSDHDYLATVWIRAVLRGNDYDSQKSKTTEDAVHPVSSVDIVAVVESPVISLPYVRNKRFHGRSIALEKLHESFLREPKDVPIVTTICGLGGMGKSQLALEYPCKLPDNSRISFLFFCPYPLSSINVENKIILSLDFFCQGSST